MTAADMAQTKLCHMVLSGKKYEICYFSPEVRKLEVSMPFFFFDWRISLTSRLKSTPPIGDPKATEIPEAAAAESTSRFRAINGLTEMLERILSFSKLRLTFIVIDIGKQLDKHVCAATCYMHQGAFFSQPHSRRHGKNLRKVSKLSIHRTKDDG